MFAILNELNQLSSYIYLFIFLPCSPVVSCLKDKVCGSRKFSTDTTVFSKDYSFIQLALASYTNWHSLTDIVFEESKGICAHVCAVQWVGVTAQPSDHLACLKLSYWAGTVCRSFTCRMDTVCEKWCCSIVDVEYRAASGWSNFCR